MTFVNFITSPSILFVICGGIFSAILSYLSARRNEKITKYLSIGILISSILVIIGGGLSAFSDYEKSLLLESKTDQIYALTENNFKLGLQVADLSKQNQKLNEYIINSITGGNSFCYYRIVQDVSKPKNYLSRMLVHVGEFPLYDLSIRIVDAYKTSKAIDGTKNFNFGKYVDSQTFINKATFFKPGQGNILQYMPEAFQLPNDTEEQHYSMFFTARSGNWIQRVKLRKISGEWTWASKVTRGNVVLYQYSTPAFPKDKDGNILW